MLHNEFYRLMPVPKGWRLSRSEHNTWCTETTCSFDLVGRILYDPARIDQHDVLLAEANRPAPVADVAVDLGGLLRVVSRRVRAIIEEHAPDDCQFLPVDVRFGGVSLGREYFVLKCLKVVDCADCALPLGRVNDFPLVYMMAKLRPERVPADTCLFQVKHTGASLAQLPSVAPLAVLVRESLRRALVQARLDGGGFHFSAITRVQVLRPA